MRDLDLELLDKVSGGSDCDDDCHPMPDPDHERCYIWKWQEVCVYENDIPCIKL